MRNAFCMTNSSELASPLPLALCFSSLVVMSWDWQSQGAVPIGSGPEHPPSKSAMAGTTSVTNTFLGSIAKSNFHKITRKMSYRLLLTFGSCLGSFDFSRPGMAVLLNNVDCFGVCFVPSFVFFVVFCCCKLEMPRRHRRIMKSWLKCPGLRTCYKEC